MSGLVPVMHLVNVSDTNPSSHQLETITLYMDEIWVTME
jgi:hypothetical protein